MRQIDLLVIHCSDTPNGRWTTVADIDLWHRQRGFKRQPACQAAFNPALSSIGYHFVIYTNGGLVTARDVGEVGAHAAGWNAHSIGICIVGRDSFSAAQWQQAADQVRHLAAKFKVPLALPDFKPMPPDVPRGVCGHRDLPGVSKTCPGFDVGAWLAGGLAPLADQVLAGAK